ncbi:PREDICTED: cadherin-4-like [Nicrophorus vespilloides]|uniref:Cadherin-4-like n=1 Tax=Nicrophorus vespilloides TaxID=110193 RepID=A0ABM1MW04_NICVS|nr:PREDICTED: cadherin-4-like [Nicrophorus vespilloides]
MRWIVLWLFFILRHMPLYAQNDGDCGDWSSMKDVNDITDQDDFKILEVTDFAFTANDVKVSMCNGIEIVRHEVNENKLLFITQNMRNWEETMPNQDSLAVICFNVAFSNEECSGKTVNMKIQDTNNYEPRFVDEQEVDKPVFEIILPMPFPAEFPLDSFGSIIMAKDEDYTDTKLTFTIESNKFLDIKYVGTTGELKKVHTASLISMSPLDFDEMQFNIKVEDKDKKIDTGKIVIKKNPKVSLVYPEFDKSYYMGKYDRDGMSEMIDEITLKNAKTIILEGAYAQYFEAFIVDDKVRIVPQKPLTETKDQNVIFTIKATNNEGYSDEATIIIEPIVTDLPKFSESYYLGSLDIESKELTHDKILVVADNDAKIDINDEDLKQIFTVALTGQQVLITLSQNANIEEIKDTDIVLPLQITNSNGGAATTIVVFEVIRKIVEPISFSKTNYQGELNVDTNVIKLEAEIKIVKGEADAVKILEQEYESQFEVTIEPITKIVNIELKEKLNNVEQLGLILTLEVSNMKGQSSKTTVVLKFTGKATQTQPIKFEKPFYKGEVDVASEQIIITEIIKITEGEVEDVKIIDTEYNEYFQATLSPDKKSVTIKLVNGLPPKVESSIVLVIEAFNVKNEVGRTTLVLDISDEETPITFTQLIYKGNVNKDKEEINLDAEIKIEKGDVESVSIVDGAFKEFFKATFSVETKIVTIEFEKTLPSTVESSIILVIEASNKQHQVGRTTVVLEVPDGAVQETPITFTQLIYKGNLNKDKEEVNLDTEIKIEKGDVETVSIVDGEYNEFFKATLTDNNKVVTIELVKELPQITKSYIDLEIEVSNDKKQVGKTVVILEVENNLPVDDLINFTEPLYKGELNVITNEITVDTIKIDTGAVEIIKILGDYENLFKVDYDKNTKIVTLTVSGNLETINEPSVVFTLAAYNAKNEIGGQTTVVLTIVGDVIKPSPPTFEKTYYEGEFKVEGQSLNIEDIRIIKGDIESVIVVGNDYNTYFEAKYNEDTKLVEIIKLQELENILDSNIVFSLEASDKYGQSADATVVLKVLGKAEPEQDRIVFDEHEVGFILEEAEQLPKQLNPFVAKSTNNKDKITYRFIDSVPNGLKLDENTGVVSIVKILDKRVLSVKLGASGSDSGKSAETKFVIYSYQLQGNGEKATYSYIAKKVKEGVETATTILQHQNTDYKYCLLESNPNDEKITINEDGYLVSKELDREDHAFVDMIVPQYLVTVDLVKKSENCEKAKTSRMQKEIVEHINMYDQIENWESRTVVTVLIEDENDHDPIFEPSKQIIAYPEEEIAKIIRPMYLTKVHATDLDSKDKFGKITYSSDSDYVVVNEDSGIIYPTDKIFSSDDFDFTVIATDGGGKTAELEVEVSLIDKDKISIMSFENIDLENIVDKLQELSEQSGINLQALSISAVPSEKSMLFKDYNYYTQAYVYGVKDNKIVSSNTIKENFNDVTVIEFNPNTSDGCDAEIEECDNTGLIAGVAVLAVLLAVVLAGSIAFYVLKLRKHNSASNDFNHHNDVERIIEKNAVREQPNNRRSTGFVFNSPPPEDDDVDLNPNNNEKIGDDFDRNLERRKSVSFNDQIETIKIDKTVPAEETEDSDAKKE